MIISNQCISKAWRLVRKHRCHISISSGVVTPFIVNCRNTLYSTKRSDILHRNISLFPDVIRPLCHNYQKYLILWDYYSTKQINTSLYKKQVHKKNIDAEWDVWYLRLLQPWPEGEGDIGQLRGVAQELPTFNLFHKTTPLPKAIYIFIYNSRFRLNSLGSLAMFSFIQ